MSGRKEEDEILYCERCGISFLWSLEEQRQLAEDGQRSTAPTHCPACRYLLPSADYNRGLVKFFNTRKQFGFLIRRGAPDLYLHSSAVIGRTRLREGDLVEFRVVDSPRGPMAAEVRLVERHQS
jgi:CspA family cold shock protein